jgi:hypothetical protein
MSMVDSWWRRWCVRATKPANLDRAWLVQAGRTLSTLLKDDYDRLRLILGHIDA